MTEHAPHRKNPKTGLWTWRDTSHNQFIRVAPTRPPVVASRWQRLRRRFQ